MAVQNVCSFMCGIEIPIPEDNENYLVYKERSLERIDEMIRIYTDEYLTIDYH